MTAKDVRRSVVVTLAAMVVVASAMIPASIAAQAPAAKLDITGAWVFTVTIDGAVSGTPTVTFKQEGEKVTGHYSSATLGEDELTGTLKGNKLDFTFPVDQIGTVTYAATVESNTAMKGTIDVGGLTNGTFAGKRKEP